MCHIVRIGLFGFGILMEAFLGQAESATSTPNTVDGWSYLPTWEFRPSPDDFQPNALLDLRSLNEAEAGESGFIRVGKDGHFVLGNGTPIRFWAYNFTGGLDIYFHNEQGRINPSEDYDTDARFLAKRGINMVRLYILISPPEADDRIEDINKIGRDWAWHMVAALKKQGIYSTLSLYWSATTKINPKWGINPVDGTFAQGKNSPLGLLFFDPAFQKAYRGWTKQLLVEKNPYTGLALRDDPSLALIQLNEEDSLYWWSADLILKGPHRAQYEELYAKWLIKKYGTLAAAVARWEGEVVSDLAKEGIGDDPLHGIVRIVPIWNLVNPKGPPNEGLRRRFADQTEFIGTLTHDFYRDTASYLHNDLGCKQLINASDWKTASDRTLNDAERWSYTSTDVLSVNRYFSGVRTGPGWRTVSGDTFVNLSMLKNPLAFPLNLKHVLGHPMVITETEWNLPMSYRSEGPLLVAAYQSLTGLDGVYWFDGDNRVKEWNAPPLPESPLQWFYTFCEATPDVLAEFPATALMYRKGYVRSGEPVIREERSLNDLWERRTPVISEQSDEPPISDKGGVPTEEKGSGEATSLAFLAGPVEVTYGGDPAKTRIADLSALVDFKKKTVHSVTGELTWNYGLGACTIDAPKAQGVTAFFHDHRDYNLTDLHIHVDNDYGAILAVSMDDLPIRESKKILVQVGTQCRPTGWSEEPVSFILKPSEKTIPGTKVISIGNAPWRVVEAICQIAIDNPGLTKATTLDMNGNATGQVALKKTAHGVSCLFPRQAMYLILQ